MKTTPREKGDSLPAACGLFSRGVIFTRARVSLARISLRTNGGLLVVYVDTTYYDLLLRNVPSPASISAQQDSTSATSNLMSGLGTA